MFEITIALITTAAIGLYFQSTRWLGLAAVATLAATYPVAIVFVCAAIGATYYFRYIRPRRRKPHHERLPK